MFVECVMTKVTRADTMQQVVADGIQLLHSVLQYDTKVSSSVRSCSSNVSVGGVYIGPG